MNDQKETIETQNTDTDSESAKAMIRQAAGMTSWGTATNKTRKLRNQLTN